MTSRARTIAVVVVLACAASACTDSERAPAASDPAGAASATAPPEASPVTSATARPTASPGTQPTAAAAPAQRTRPPFPGDTRRDTEEAEGGPLSVTAVRAARQDGYDRVVFELAGRNGGAPGWFAEYTSDPRQDGSGDRVAVSGSAVLAVTITGVGYPGDTGAEQVSDPPRLPRDLRSVRDVEFGSLYEGQFQAFVGLNSKRAFTVRRLANPARVVVDVAH